VDKFLMIGLGGLLLTMVGVLLLLWSFKRRRMPIDATEQWEQLRCVGMAWWAQEAVRQFLRRHPEKQR
jgi:hypothetical protein